MLKHAVTILSGIILAATAMADTEFKELWRTNLVMLVESAPTVADLNGDGVDEIVVASREDVIAVDGHGKELWRWRTKARFMTYPAILPREGKSPLIIVSDTSGWFSCLDGAGAEVWHAQLVAPTSWCAAAIGDLDGDGKAEAVQGDEQGGVAAFSAEDGAPLWRTMLKGAVVSPCVADLDGDGHLEIVVTTNAGVLALLRSDGTVAWQQSIGTASQTWATASPILYRVSDGSYRIGAAAVDGRVLCLKPDGRIVWSQPVRGTIASTLSAGDMDFDGKTDLFAITQTGVIYRFDEAGNALWTIDMGGRSLAGGALFDLGGNGNAPLVYALFTQSGRFMVFDNTASVLYDRQFEARTINLTPTLGELQPETSGLEMAVTLGESGRIACLSTAASADKDPRRKQWIAYHADAAKSGAWPGLSSEGGERMAAMTLAAGKIFAGEEVRFNIDNPKRLRLKATASCSLGAGRAVQTAMTTVVGESGVLLLPLKITEGGRYTFSWGLSIEAEKSGVKPTVMQCKVDLVPLRNERILLDEAAARVRDVSIAVASVLPLSAAALGAEGRTLEANRALLGEPDEAKDAALLDKAAAMVKHAKRVIALADLIEGAAQLGPNTSILPFDGTLWESRGVDGDLPKKTEGTIRIARRAVLGEHEPVSVRLLNITDRTLRVRVVAETAGDALGIDLFNSVDVPTSIGETSWDPLPEIDETSTVTIPPLLSREVWLDIAVAENAAGTCTAKVKFQALNGAGVFEEPSNAHDVAPPEVVAEIALNVLPFKMLESAKFRTCAWAKLSKPVADNMYAHGNNVFCLPNGAPVSGADNRLTGVDFAKTDEVLDWLAGKDVVALLTGVPALKMPPDSAEYKEDLRKFMEETAAHFASKGFRNDQFALYPFDEPGGNGWSAVNAMVAFSSAVKAVAPNIRIYVDGGAELPMFEKMAPYIDIWCPAISMLPEKSPEMELLRSTKGEMWSYNCGYGFTTASRSSLKNTNVVAEYRTAALYAFRHDATGIGFWSYNIGADAWTRAADDYPIVYAGRTKPVSSRRWKAVREGIEDYRILAALRAQRDAAISEEVRKKIDHLIDESLPRWMDQMSAEVLLGLSRYVYDASSNDTTMNALRNEMLDCIQALQETPK